MVSWNTQNADIFHLEEQLIKAFFEKVALKKLLKKNLANNDNFDIERRIGKSYHRSSIFTFVEIWKVFWII